MSESQAVASSKKSLFDKRCRLHCIKLNGMNDPFNDKHYHDTVIWYPSAFITGLDRAQVMPKKLLKNSTLY